MLVVFCLSSCKVGRFFVYIVADIKDHKIFANRTVETGDSTFYFTQGIEKKPDSVVFDGETFDFDQFLKKQKSVAFMRSEEHTSELQSRPHLVCRLLLEKK